MGSVRVVGLMSGMPKQTQRHSDYEEGVSFSPYGTPKKRRREHHLQQNIAQASPHMKVRSVPLQTEEGMSG
jgi:hypothetical protein